MAYGGMTPNMFGTKPSIGNSRDRITQALMRIGDPPPGSLMAGGAGMPPQQPLPPPGGAAQPPQPAVLNQIGGGGLPQQPAALGAAAPPMGAMGPVAGPYNPSLPLPGITPPGVLPQRGGGY
jgi:hypothetical protein